MKYALYLFVFLISSVLTGCGEYGGLYLPDHNKAHSKEVVTHGKPA